MSRACLLILFSFILLPAQNLYFGSRYQVQLSNVYFGRTDAAVVADFNEDSVPDIAIPGYGVGVAILLGNRAGAFESPRFLRFSNCWSLTTADFDGDGHADLAGVEGGRNAVFVVRGDGTGQFSEPAFYPAPPTPYRIAVADLNGDSCADILVSDRNAGTVTVLLNRGDGKFGPPAASPAGTDPTFLVAGDFNGDSIPDAVTVNFGERHASLLAGVGDGSFLMPVTIAEGTSVYNVTAADFNEDGRLDLAFGTMHEYIYVLLATEDGGFSEGDWYYFGRFAHLTSGDVDHDGHADLFGVLRGGAGVVLMRGYGDGHFGEPRKIAALSDPSYVTLADINADGRLDAVVTSYDLGVLSLLLNPITGSTWPVAYTAGPARPTALATADFDGDSKRDLAVTTSGVGGAWVMRGFGDGTLGPPVRYDAGAGPSAIVAVDLNKDGAADIAVANQDSGDVSVLLNKGDGTFRPALSTGLADCAPTAISAADFNKDGIADLTLGCLQATAVLILPGRGDGTFEPAVVLTPANSITRFVVADLNADTIPDIAVLGGGLALYFGNGDATFRGPVSLPASAGCSDLLAADWNEDSAPDLAAACPGANRAIFLFLNSGTGSFQRVEVAANALPGLLAAGDLTGDGHADLVFFQEPQTIATYAGSGDGAFTPTAALGISGSVGPVAVADFNGDARADLVTLEAPSSRVLLFLSAPAAGTIGVPIPLSPAANEAIPQNNPASTCPYDPIRGSGFRLLLRWTPVPAVTEFVVMVERRGGLFPTLTTRTRESDSTLLQVCTFIPDSELEGWSWRIRSQDTIGNLSPWSEPAEFRFSPCRLADGRPCGTNPPPVTGGQVPMLTARAAHTVTLLRNGKVLVTGGLAPQGSGVVTLQTAELYDPATRTFLPAGRMQNPRAYHTATLLPDGKVLLAGGMNVAGSQSPVPVAALEVYDPEQDAFTAVGTITARNSLTATLLADGRVLLAGGIPGQGAFLNVAEVYQPATHVVAIVSPMISRRAFHTATLLRDGRVLMIGGEGTNPEFFHPSTNSFVASPANLPRFDHTATLLPDDSVLVTGGISSQGPEPAGPVIFNPSTGTVASTGAMIVPRAGHTATALADGRVLVLGGRTTAGESLAVSEVYSPVTRSFTPGPPLATPRVLHTATLFGDGMVLAAGGFRIAGGAQSWLGTAEVVGPVPGGN
ncbi:MAG: VCBS repeat-containing protein [Bryobacterales bacterium]|nr:VCBS repeat-containing protein [Bryobacterales bacterium]